MKVRLMSFVAGSVCDWGTVFTSVPYFVLVSPAKGAVQHCHGLLDPRTDRDPGMSPTGPVFDFVALCYHDHRATCSLLGTLQDLRGFFSLFSYEPLLALFPMQSAPRAERQRCIVCRTRLALLAESVMPTGAEGQDSIPFSRVAPCAKSRC